MPGGSKHVRYQLEEEDENDTICRTPTPPAVESDESYLHRPGQIRAAPDRRTIPFSGQSCPKCKNIYAVDSRFCRKCGHRREEVETTLLDAAFHKLRAMQSDFDAYTEVVRTSMEKMNARCDELAEDMQSRVNKLEEELSARIERQVSNAIQRNSTIQGLTKTVAELRHEMREEHEDIHSIISKQSGDRTVLSKIQKQMAEMSGNIEEKMQNILQQHTAVSRVPSQTAEVAELRKTIQSELQDIRGRIAIQSDVSDTSQQNGTANISQSHLAEIRKTMFREHQELHSKIDTQVTELSESIEDRVRKVLLRNVTINEIRVSIDDLRKTMQREHKDIRAKVSGDVSDISEAIQAERQEILATVKEQWKEFLAVHGDEAMERLTSNLADIRKSTHKEHQDMHSKICKQLEEVSECMDSKLLKFSQIADKLQGPTPAKIMGQIKDLTARVESEDTKIDSKVWEMSNHLTEIRKTMLREHEVLHSKIDELTDELTANMEQTRGAKSKGVLGRIEQLSDRVKGDKQSMAKLRSRLDALEDTLNSTSSLVDTTNVFYHQQCPQGHPLTIYVHSGTGGNFCNMCNRKGICPPECVFRCQDCDYDLCESCYQSAQAPISCSSCGNHYMPDSRFCRKCGQKRVWAGDALSAGVF
eukprot:TRINITY_DN76871_c0_g1_i1.p1 TRINITY_DN76871_c0_g1~~TRINITY_DN76871_c0_g1_i1.p1  ORF type:complete len:644 (-),score=104.49 TRINITY_DN76871_c0_g1_i1:91-2022(-)